MLGLASRSSSAFRLSPGTYLAVSAVPVGGATANQPALFLLSPRAGAHPVAIVANAPSGGFVTTTDGRTTIASGGTSSGQQAYDATALPFTLPAAPGPHGTQALAVGTANGGVTYDIAYSLVTVTAGAPVDETNSAFAYADCTACTTVAVSFQVVLVVGESNQITPINAAGALNRNCLSCVTTAIADQIVVTITKQPTPDLQRKLEAAISQLGGLPALGANGTPASIAAQVQAVQDQVNQLLQDSGLLVQPLTAPTPDATTAGSPNTSMASAAPTDSASASPTSSSASPAASSSTSTGPSDSAAPSGSDSPSSSTTP
jgi:putative peptide zinc metalloprotease protein